MGTQEHRDRIHKELDNEALKLVKDHYGHFCVLKLLKYGTAPQRSFIINKFYGNVKQLSSHKEASGVLEQAYCEYANKDEKCSILQEFYGLEYAKFKTPLINFDDLMADPEKKKKTLRYLRTSIMLWTNKINVVIDHSLLHRPILQYMMNTDHDGRKEIINFLIEHVLRILHTEDGAKVICMCIQNGTPKDRKVIVQNCRGYFTKIFNEEFGYTVILTLLSCVDDTVTLAKKILKEISEDFLSLCSTTHGCLCLLACIANSPESRFFPSSSKYGPVLIPDPTDKGKLVLSSKKDPKLRQKEISDAMTKHIFSFVVENVYPLITEIQSRDLITEIYAVIDLNKKMTLIDAILQWIHFDEDDFNQQQLAAIPNRKYHPMEKIPELPTKKYDLLLQTLSSYAIKKLTRNCPIFCQKLLDKIKDNITEYANASISSWIILSLLTNESTSQQVKTLLTGVTLLEEQDDNSKQKSAVLLLQNQLKLGKK